MKEPLETKKTETNIYEMLDTLWRRKILVAICLGGVLLPIVIANFTTPPVYESQTTIIFEQWREPIPTYDISEAFTRKTYIVNQIEEIKSRALAEEVAQKLDEPTASLFLNVRVKNLSPPKRLEILTGQIKKSISAEPIRDSDVILIRAQGPTPEAAARVANLAAETIKERNASVKREQASSTRRFIQEQLPAVESNLNRTEEALKSFKSLNQVISLSDEAKGILSKVTDTDLKYSSAITERQSLEQRLAAINDQLRFQKNGVNNGPEVTSGVLADSLRKSLIDLQMRATLLSIKGYGTAHPQMQELNSQIEATRIKLSDELKQITQNEFLSPMPQMERLLTQIPQLQIELATASAKERALKRILDEYEFQLSRLPDKELQLARLLRAKEVTENIYKMLSEKYEEARITEAGRIGNVRVIDPARQLGSPIKPRKQRNLTLGLIVGLILGVGSAIFVESLDSSVRSAEELESRFSLPVLGLIPTIHPEELHRYRKKTDADEAVRIAATLVTHYSPKSPVSEAYRTLRTNIQFSQIDSPLKTIVISSPGPGEGKSTTVANLAITTALAGVKTLLVDADLRRAIIHSLFELNREPGLINLLAEKFPPEKVITPSGIENLNILPCGTIPPNPSELLGSQQMKELLKSVSAKYDLVLLDSPPVITVTDTAVVASEVDAVILVVLSHSTDRGALQRARTLLSHVRANLVGAVLNRIEHVGLSAKYDYYYRYYYYAEDRPK
ncbi:MAG: polysaccharide biosynthesis tyrosine autokinase [Candidatus Edwardsbacteria bacterium]